VLRQQDTLGDENWHLQELIYFLYPLCYI
jgi:hypothetical protein